MKTKDNYAALAKPLNVDDLKIEELRTIEKELSESPLVRKLMNALSETCTWRGTGKTFGVPNNGVRLPDAYSPFGKCVADWLRHILRLTCEVRLYVLPDESRLCGTQVFLTYPEGAEQQDPTLASLPPSRVCFQFPRPALEKLSFPELLFVTGEAFAQALDPCPPYPILLGVKAPLDFGDRLKVMRLDRYRSLAYQLAGALCCQDMAAAQQSIVRQYAGLDGPWLGGDFDALVSDAIRAGEMSEEFLLESTTKTFSPMWCYAMRRFFETDVCKTHLGGDGSVPWSQFSNEIQAIDKRIHPRLTSLPDSDAMFRTLALPVAMHAVAEVDGKLTPDEEGVIRNMCSEQAMKVMQDRLEWKPGVGGNSMDHLGSILRESGKPVANRHAVEILQGCILVAQVDGELTDKEQELIMQIAQACEIGVAGVNAIREAMVEKASKE